MSKYELSPHTIGTLLLLTMMTVGLGASLIYATDVYLLGFLAVELLSKGVF